MSDASGSTPHRRASDRRAEWIILGFVVASIVLLLVIPIGVARRNEDLRSRMDQVIDPAREWVTDVQYNLARDMGSLRGYVLTGDTLFLTRHRAIREETDRGIEQLAELVPALGGAALDAFVELRIRVDRWHGVSADDDGGAGGGGAGDGLADDAEAVRAAAIEQRRYQAALQAAARLDAAVAEAARTLREDIRSQERGALRYTFLLALLALAAATALVWLGTRLRRLAVEAERQRRDAQEALAQNRRALEARYRLMRGVTHDVKNPLGAADGYAELLQLGLRGPLEPAQGDTVQSIRRSISAALHTINDLLALSEVEDPRLGLTPEAVQLGQLVRDAVDAHRGVAEAAGRSLLVDGTGPDPVIRTDPRRVEQVLGNLLSNAIKHSAPGGDVRIAIVVDPGEPAAGAAGAAGAAPSGAGSGARGAAGPRVGVRVSDTGPGIRPEHLERVFDEFQRLDRSKPGHGLGLTISRTVARRLGGDLVAESRPGEGATFTLWLPGSAVDETRQRPDREESHGAAATG